MQALILAGGSGTRFWPLSRRSRPKQLLALEGERSLLQETAARLRPLIGPQSTWVCTTRRLADSVRAELPEVPPQQVLSEPVGRNTGPAIGWSVRQMLRRGEDPVVAVLPADHRMGKPDAFRRALAEGERAIEREDRVLTLGVTPRWPETGYGYLELGEVLDAESGLRRVLRFTEKPDAESAQRFFDSGGYLWNAGIFVFRASTLDRLLERFAPEIAGGLRAIEAEPERGEELYAELPSISIDFAVMERAERLATLPLDCGWSDLGSWAALAEVLPRDAEGNAARGDVVITDSKENLLWADQGAIAALGISGLVVVRTADAVLVAPKERVQEVRRIVEELEARKRGDLL